MTWRWMTKQMTNDSIAKQKKTAAKEIGGYLRKIVHMTKSSKIMINDFVVTQTNGGNESSQKCANILHFGDRKKINI